MQFMKKFGRDEKGATAIEYGLIAALIAIALIAGARSLGGALNTKFSTISTEVTNASAGSTSGGSSSGGSTTPPATTPPATNPPA